MIKIILWRLSYHFFCFLKLIGWKGPQVRYFAYGGNLDPKVIQRRNITLVSFSPYFLENYQLVFNHSIPYKNLAMGSVDPCEGKKVPGMLYVIHKIDELRLDCMEAHWIFKRYGKKNLIDENENAFFFFYSNRPQEGLFPLTVYAEKLLNGYQAIGNIPEEYIEFIKNTPTIENRVPLNPPHFLIQDYECLGKFLKPLLVAYDRLCLKFFGKLIAKPSWIEKFY